MWHDSILELENIWNADQCDTFIKLIENMHIWKPSPLSNDVMVPNIRTSDQFTISTLIKPFPEFKSWDILTFETCRYLIQQYHAKYRWLRLQKDEGYYVLRYKVDQQYVMHTDYDTRNPRQLSIMLYLNDSFEGGELKFLEQNLCIKPGIGKAVIFPSNFLFPHASLPIISGTKYAISTFVN